ncbi:DUF2637 domain-containing protein [Streptomyces sp. NPDC002845]
MHRVLIGVVVTGAVVIAGIGFAGSYAAVRELALQKGFGDFSYVFPIGIDAGICVLLALDLLLTWIRIPFPLLRQTAWLLTAATIAFNGAAAWPDPLGVGMHAVIPILFVVAVEAARHAIGRIADITADKHMEGVRLTRWLLSPVPTFLLWRRMKLWELRSYDQVIKLEQERLVYRARLRSRYGRAWRRKAPVESLMPLRLAKYGVPLAETAPAGLAAAGIEPALLPPATATQQQALEAAPSADTALPTDAAAVAAPAADITAGNRAAGAAPVPQRAAPPSEQHPQPEGNHDAEHPEYDPAPDHSPWFNPPQQTQYQGSYDPTYEPDYEQWYAQQQAEQQHPQEPHYEDQYEERYGQRHEERYEEPPTPHQEPSPEDTGSFPIPVGPNRTRELGEGGGTPAPEPDEESYYTVFKQSINGSYPTPREFSDNVEATYGVPVPDADAKRMVNRFTNRHTAELQEDHIA